MTAFEQGWSLVKEAWVPVVDESTEPTRPAEDDEMHLVGRTGHDGLPHVTNEKYDTANGEYIANEKGMEGHQICPHCGEEDPSLEIDLDQGMISEMDSDAFSVEHDVDCESCGHSSSITQYLQLTGFERQ